MKVQYYTQGTCCKLMNIDIDGDTIKSAEFIGGCEGNLKGISKLIEGMKIDEIIKKFSGLTCGGKDTSCPDQLSKCLVEYLKQIQTTV